MQKKTEDLLDLDKKYRKLRIQKTKFENHLERAERALEGLNIPTKEEFSVLQSFFPSIKIKKLYDIEKFHESLTKVLKKQISDEILDVKTKLDSLNSDFETITRKYEQNIPDGSFSKATLNVYGEKYLELQKLYENIEIYRKGKRISYENSLAKESLDKKEIQVLAEISEKINMNMKKLNKHIQNGQWKDPILKFIPPKTKNTKGISNYSISSGTDKGDGTENANIIMFDLSVLHLTKLPAIAHDLFVRWELDEIRQEDCIKLYALENDKQIFTAFCSIKNYSSEIQKIIEDKTVLKLFVNGGELYGTSEWTKQPV